MIRYGFHEHYFSILDSFIICLGEDHFGLNTWSDSLASWNSMSKSLPSFGKFSAIVSFDKLFALLFHFWDSVMYKLVLLMASHNSCKFSSLSFIRFVLLTRWIQMTCLLVHRFFCLVESVLGSLYWIFWLSLCSLTRGCLFVILNNFYFFVELPVLFMHCFSNFI